MTQPTPKFQVGQLVMIESEDYPEYNGGPYKILSSVYRRSIDKLTGKLIPECWYYSVIVNNDNWRESALRPYNPPEQDDNIEFEASDKSFSELMSEWTCNKESV